MGMRDLLSLGERLNNLMEKTEAEVAEIITNAQTQADEMITTTKEEAERRLQRAQYRTGLDEFLKEAEAEAKQEAEKTEKAYTKSADDIKKVSEEKIIEAVKLLVMEVLPE
jgi:cell division septum initiation protein DivIVA